MNVLTRELKSCMSQFASGSQGDFSALFIFPAGFSGFTGHFPGKPVLPGVCMVQAVLVMLDARRRIPVTLKCIVSAKWLAPVKPEAELRFVCSEKQNSLRETTVKARITCDGEKVAELTLLVIHASQAGDGSP